MVNGKGEVCGSVYGILAGKSDEIVIIVELKLSGSCSYLIQMLRIYGGCELKPTTVPLFQLFKRLSVEALLGIIKGMHC